MTGAPLGDAPALTCHNCGDPLARLFLRGHYGRPVEVDVCRGCHLLWFDSLEASRLSGSGMIDLVREMAAGHAAPHRALRRDLGCVRCGETVRRVINRSRFGRAEQLECRQGHGAWHTYGQWLAERGLVRPVTSRDAAIMVDRGISRHCFNCGGPARAGDTAACGWCGAAAVLMDIGRLLQAVDPEGATRSPGPTVGDAAAVTGTPARVDAACHACADTVEGPAVLRCGRCGVARRVGDLGDALRALEVIEPALRAHEEKPVEHVRARRLSALSLAGPRRRASIRALEHETRSGGPVSGGSGPGADDHRGSGLLRWLRSVSSVGWALAISWLAWIAWGR
jgi:hypothetical protein